MVLDFDWRWGLGQALCIKYGTLLFCGNSDVDYCSEEDKIVTKVWWLNKKTDYEIWRIIIQVPVSHQCRFIYQDSFQEYFYKYWISFICVIQYSVEMHKYRSYHKFKFIFWISKYESVSKKDNLSVSYRIICFKRS